MSDDLIEKAEALCAGHRGGQSWNAQREAYARRYMQLKEIVPELVAEIKRLREENNEQKNNLIKNLSYIKWLDENYKKEYKTVHKEQWKWTR